MTAVLADIVEELESGSRPKGGVSSNGDVFSLGGEHIGADGQLDLTSPKRISRSFYECMERGRVQPYDILIVKDGATTGKTAFFSPDSSFDAAVNEHVFRLKVDQTRAFPKYVFHFLSSPRGQREVLRDFRGATVGGIGRTFVDLVRLSLPDLAEQRRVADVLDRADSVRRKRKDAVVLSEELLRSAFLEMFGDPVTNSKGWPVKPLGELLAFLTSGSRGWAEYYSDEGDVFLRIQNVKHDRLDLADVASVNAPDSAEARRTKTQAGDVLLSITADLGRTAVVPDGLKRAFINQHLAILRPRGVNPEYLSSFLASEGGQRQIRRLNKGGVKAGLNFDDIRSVSVSLPSSGMQEAFAEAKAKIRALEVRYERSVHEANRLFDTLTARAFAGLVQNAEAAC